MTPLDRRGFLRVATTTACAACLPLGACNQEEKPAGPLVIDPVELPEGTRVRREWNGRPVELVRRGDKVTARSLLCEHVSFAAGHVLQSTNDPPDATGITSSQRECEV